jgi:hypothetical protein
MDYTIDDFFAADLRFRLHIEEYLLIPVYQLYSRDTNG